ncbi:hypothetical protein [Anoxybacillus sp. J5B_2022]|jgi:hypothetical protein|uniref:hypothetical protein n=1 Tax=Anoxybacillus sp. J5B_2022 TaxID=3003246 RepID=UPI0022864884|nr:hypothetical protein [Anoxybacillus sp. J5B_2022]MCZ0756014.1 hypothetical protein [Anoxybacillus sp. J5B_2022]
MELTAFSGLEAISDTDILQIDGGIKVNWWQLAEGVTTLAAASGFYVTAAFLTPTVAGAAASAAVGMGLQVAAYSTIAGAFK